MAQNLTQRVTSTFVRGLITEAGPLTFPEDASVDELNCVLERDGSRRKRMGLRWEAQGTSIPEDTLLNVLVWENVGGKGDRAFLGLQYGQSIKFYSLNVSNPSTTSPSLPTFSFSSYVVPSSFGMNPLEGVSVHGHLVLVGEDINPFYLTYNETNNTLTGTPIKMEERDFEWLSDTDPFSNASVDEGTSAGRLRKYDVRNSGWVGTNGTAALTSYVTSESSGPPLTHPWYSGKKSDGTFDVDQFKKVFVGNSLTANGHFIIDLWERNKAAASLIPDIPTVPETGRFSTLASYAGRVFFSGITYSTTGRSNRVYFSQLIKENMSNVGKFYQINDPTSEEFSDLLDTDGGYVSIPEAYNIKKLHVFGPTLYVFAQNGIWAISGVDDVFRATEFSVSRLSEVGIQEKESFVSAESRPYWWSDHGIHTLVLNDQIGTIVEENITRSTIQTFFRNIPPMARSKVKGIYDERNQKVYWIYPDDPYSNNLDRALIFDEAFTAFVPWKFEGSYRIRELFYNPVQGQEGSNVDVEADGGQVEASAGDVYVTQFFDNFSTGIKFVVYGSDQSGFAETQDASMLDFGEWGYDSFCETGYDFMGDLTVFKNAPYVTVLAKTTETGYVGDEDTGYQPLREGSLTLQAIWDFKKNSGAPTQQVYRLKSPLIVDPERLNENQIPVTDFSTRLKVRGRGRHVRLRFEGEHGKDWHLLGWEVIGARNPTF